MKIALPILTLMALAVAAPTESTGDTAMRNCVYGFNYCGSDLLSIGPSNFTFSFKMLNISKGNYEGDIEKALTTAGQPVDVNHIKFSLFNCNGPLGGIQFIKFCGVNRCRQLGLEYGNYVRTGPRELTIFDPAAIQPILGFGSKTTKGPFYGILEESLHMTRNKSFHRQHRKIWDVAIKHHLESFAFRVEEITSDLLARINASSKETIPLKALFREYSFDVIGVFAFGKPFGFITGQASKAEKEILAIIDASVHTKESLIHLPWLIEAISSVAPEIDARKRWNDWTKEQLKEQLATKDSLSSFMSRLIVSTPSTTINYKTLMADTRLVIGAGLETTAAVLLFVFIHLGIHSEYQFALRKELDGVEFSCEKPIPMLDAIISESMRLWPSVFFGQRVTPPEGLQINDQIIPGNTIIALATFAMSRDERNFVHPNEFIPERWTTKPELCLNKSAFIPFIIGSYMCVGRNLAMMELRSVVARVVGKYRVVLPGDFDGSFFNELQDSITLVAPEVRARFIPVSETPDSDCWPSDAEWSSLNSTLSGALIRGVPPGSVCYPDQPDYSEDACAIVRSHWFNSTWHAESPISIDYPVWTNNSCNPIFPNGTSVTGDVHAGEKGCSIGSYPVYAVKATTAEQIAEALKWAGTKNIRIVVKNTGHSYPGRSVGYGSLSIWTHNLRGIEYIPSFKPTNCPVDEPLTAARAAAGTTGIEAQVAMSKHGSILVTGANPDVGIVGWLTGGGHGPLSSTYGMGADNLLEATIVTPSGDILVANPCESKDLFFAIRGGGGGTYGVVTEVIVKTYPDPKTTKILFQMSTTGLNVTSEYWDLMGFFHAEMQRLKEGGLSGYYFLVGPPSYPVYAFIGLFSIYNKPNGTMERLFAPIVQKIESRPDLFQYSAEITQANTFLEAYSTVTNELVASGGSAYASWLLSPKSLANASSTAKVFAGIGPSLNVSKPNGVVYNPSLLGHMIASPDTPSYYPSAISMNPVWRNTLTHFIVVEGWPDGIAQPVIDSVYRDVTSKVQKLRDLSPETGAYFNEPDSYEPEWQHAFFGENYERLKEAKEKYDPENVLWCRRCVGSEALVEEASGRLCAAETYSRRGEDGHLAARSELR
ncbi:hypothetical protein N0V90_004267 [Kalmusia sp. IMI 367209]|nr:hypothetical protein N0V90_004267 [Kalmusia sp. IMI 367209]